MNKILFLEDDLLFAQTLEDFLQESGFEVLHVANGQLAIDAAFKEKFDLYLLDINVPLIDGVTILQELRGTNDDTPAIFLTSHNTKEMLKKSFLSGGDDFVTKPFDADELLFRINALLKRANRFRVESVKLYHDDIHKRIFQDKKELELSKKEYTLLLLLMRHMGNTVPKELIFDELWSSSQSVSDGAIRVYINRIKQLAPDLEIQNIRGIGYRLVSQPSN